MRITANKAGYNRFELNIALMSGLVKPSFTVAEMRSAISFALGGSKARFAPVGGGCRQSRADRLANRQR